MPAALPFSVLDCFTATPFGGNPAAIVQLPTTDDARFSDDKWAASLFKEFNLPMTALITPLVDGAVNVRFGNAGGFAEMCGHATLGASSLLFSQNSSLRTITFNLTNGVSLTATLVPGPEGRISINLPADHSIQEPLKEGDAAYDEALRAAVIAAPAIVGKVLGVAKSRIGRLIEVDESVDLANLQVEPAPFANICKLFAFAKATPASDDTYDIHSRVFAPALGVSEDPVCGSAHCYMAPYFLGLPEPRARLGSSFASAEKTVLRSRQVSARGGDLLLCWDADKARLDLEGQAVLVSRGELFV